MRYGNGEMKHAFVWDLPTRVFHWTLTVLLGISVGTGLNGGLNAMDYHMLSGESVLALVGFRIIWGLVGSRNARFTNFIKGPVAIAAYLRSMRHEVGHNPLGALSVVAMLLSVAVQAVTGLFSTDDVFVDGPLRHLVSHDTALRITSIHELNLWVLGGLVGLHLVAIAWYQFKRGENLLMPMLTGWKQVTADTLPERNNVLLAVAVLAIVAGAVYYLVNYV